MAIKLRESDESFIRRVLLPNATIDASEFLVCSIMIRYVFSMSRAYCDDAQLVGAIAMQRREGFTIEKQRPRTINSTCIAPPAIWET